MAGSLNIPLTDELKKYIASQCGEGTLYATPSEFVRDLIRREIERKEAQRVRVSIIDGYQDAIDGRTIQYSGNLRTDLKKAAKKWQ